MNKDNIIWLIVGLSAATTMLGLIVPECTDDRPLTDREVSKLYRGHIDYADYEFISEPILYE